MSSPSSPRKGNAEVWTVEDQRRHHRQGRNPDSTSVDGPCLCPVCRPDLHPEQHART